LTAEKPGVRLAAGMKRSHFERAASHFDENGQNQALSERASEAAGAGQIPPDLVVKSQDTDIVEVIVSGIRRQNVSQRLWSNRNSRGELLSTSEAHWSTT
jgi:hypothetical protein